MKEKITESVSYIRKFYQDTPRIGVVLGSGLGVFQERVENPVVLSYTDIPHFTTSTATGHAGKLVFGQVQGQNVMVMSGRFHYYEGYSLQDVVYPIRVMGEMGVKILMVTNAAGGVNKAFQVGDLMVIEDHINMIGSSPLVGREALDFGQRFIDMSTTYTPHLRELAKSVGKKHNLELREGVYVATHGPNYETPAEIRMMRVMGADAVGMSTAPEAIAARQLGMEILGISCITNMAAGVTDQPLSEEEVFDTANKTKMVFMNLFEGIIAEIS